MRIQNLSFIVSITPAFDLAILVLFGLPFLMWIQLFGSFLFYRREGKPLYRWGGNFSIFAVAFTLATLIFPHGFTHIGTLPEIFPRLILLQTFLTATYSLLIILAQNIVDGMPLRERIAAEFKELFPADLLEIFLQPMLALILVALWPAYPWVIPVLFIPLYGLKLVMDNVQNVQKEMEKSIDAVGQVLEARDEYTERHTDRVSQYATIIARYCGLSEGQIETVSRVAKLHDVGKIVVRDDVLRKPDKLTREEFEHVKLHVRYDFASGLIPPQFPIAALLGLVRLHHERYDGRGYPFGLKGEEIPVEVRIVSVADAWDAMMSRRVYRSNMSEDKALQILRENSGAQWDPGAIEAFFKAYDAGDIQAVSADYKAWLKKQEWDALTKLKQFLSMEPTA